MFENTLGKIENGTVYFRKKTIVLDDILETNIIHVRHYVYGISLLLISCLFLLPLARHILGIPPVGFHESPVALSFQNVLRYGIILVIIYLGIRSLNGTYFYTLYGHEHERFRTKIKNQEALLEFDAYLRMEIAKIAIN